MTGEARGYSWEPFRPGHTLSRRHGGRSPRTYLPVARELAAGVVQRRPDLAAHPELVAEWAENQARADLCRRWLADRDVLTDDGLVEGVQGALKLQHACERRAAEAARELGLSPMAEARLAAGRADAALSHQDVAAVAEAGREALKRRGDVDVVAVTPAGEDDA